MLLEFGLSRQNQFVKQGMFPIINTFLNHVIQFGILDISLIVYNSFGSQAKNYDTHDNC